MAESKSEATAASETEAIAPETEAIAPETEAIAPETASGPDAVVAHGQRLLDHLLGHAEAMDEPLKVYNYQAHDILAMVLAGSFGTRRIAMSDVPMIQDVERTCTFVKAARQYSLLTRLPKLTEPQILSCNFSVEALLAKVKEAAVAKGQEHEAAHFESSFLSQFGDDLSGFVQHNHDRIDRVVKALRDTETWTLLEKHHVTPVMARALFPMDRKRPAGIQNHHHTDMVGKRLLSIDIVKANLTSLNLLGKAMGMEGDEAFLQWHDFVMELTGSEFYAESKMFRQIVCGKAFKSYVMRRYGCRHRLN